MGAAAASESAGRQTVPVLGAPIDAIDMPGAVARISRWAESHKSHYVCVCNAHSVVTASRDPSFAQVLQAADLALPDGAPVAWLMRRQGMRGQTRVSGPDLMAEYCEHAARCGQSIYLYGATEATLASLHQALLSRWPTLRIAGAHSPPFRPTTEEEDAADIERINASGAGTVWVSLGCPKQEVWMLAHRGRIHGVMIGVGAAFDFHAGTVARAPAWMRANGLEWLHRLASEPRRLWRRYLVTNTLFIVGAAAQLLRRQ